MSGGPTQKRAVGLASHPGPSTTSAVQKKKTKEEIMPMKHRSMWGGGTQPRRTNVDHVCRRWNRRSTKRLISGAVACNFAPRPPACGTLNNVRGGGSHAHEQPRRKRRTQQLAHTCSTRRALEGFLVARRCVSTRVQSSEFFAAPLAGALLHIMRDHTIFCTTTLTFALALPSTTSGTTMTATPTIM